MELVRVETKHHHGAWCNWCGMDIIAPDLFIQRGTHLFKFEILAYWCIPCGILLREGKL